MTAVSKKQQKRRNAHLEHLAREVELATNLRRLEIMEEKRATYSFQYQQFTRNWQTSASDSDTHCCWYGLRGLWVWMTSHQPATHSAAGNWTEYQYISTDAALVVFVSSHQSNSLDAWASKQSRLGTGELPRHPTLIAQASMRPPARGELRPGRAIDRLQKSMVKFKEVQQ